MSAHRSAREPSDTQRVLLGLRLGLTLVSLTYITPAIAAQPLVAGGVLYSFGSSDGMGPVGSLVRDKVGRLYGATARGGTYDFGTIYRLTPPVTGAAPWQEEIIFNFGMIDNPYANGSKPNGSLLMDANGTLYGTAESGGAYGFGTVFRFDPNTLSFTVLHSFRSELGIPPQEDGKSPAAGLTFGPGGLLYGTTVNSTYSSNAGTVFSISPAGDSVEYSIIHMFPDPASSDGESPQSNLVANGDNEFLGTTSGGGAQGQGTIFSLTQLTDGAWREAIVYNFLYSTADVAHPANPGNLVRGSGHVFYGCAQQGGAASYGGVFSLSPPSAGSTTWQETVLHSFNPAIGESAGACTLTLEPSGQLIGTGSEYGAYGEGGIFQLTPPKTGAQGWAYQQLVSFGKAPDGGYPSGELLREGKFYLGVNAISSNGSGTVYGFKVLPLP